MSGAMPIRTITDVEAVERAQTLEQRMPEQSSYAAIEASARRCPQRDAIVYLPNGSADDAPLRISYAQLFQRVTQTANLLHRLGVVPGEAVSCLLPNVPQMFYLLWGGAAAGIVNAVNPLLTPQQIAEILQAANSRVLVTLGPGSELWDKTQAVLKLMPYSVKLLRIGGGASAQALDFDAELESQPTDRLVSGRVIAPEDVAAYFHTGGTTGSPKLVQHTHRAQAYQAWVNRELLPLSEDDVLLLGAPLFHCAAVYCWGLAPLYAGTTIVLLSPSGFRNQNAIRDYWKIVERFRGTVGAAVPTVVSALLNVPMAGADVRSLRSMMCGAAPLSVQVFEAFQQATSVPIKEGYGLTEATALVSVNPPHGQSRVGSIGMRIPYTQVKIVQLDGQGNLLRECDVDEIGIVAVNGPTVTRGYRQAQHNQGAFFGEHWLNTGDLGRMDGDGYIWLTGRAKDLIIRGGHNISPAWIEDVLHQHPAVALAAAVGKPDNYAGELPMAYVTLKPGAQASADELREFARERVVERPAAPVEVIILDTMPMTAVGKIFKPALRYDAIARAVRASLAALGEPAASARVEVAAHERFGTLARISGAGALKARIEQALAGYTFRYEIVD